MWASLGGDRGHMSILPDSDSPGPGQRAADAVAAVRLGSAAPGNGGGGAGGKAASGLSREQRMDDDGREPDAVDTIKVPVTS
jgi:hypothetical protein